MTIIGIAGCTGLMLTGFGIRDSVVDIPKAQFGNIFKYEIGVALLNTDGLEDIEKYLNENGKIEDYTKICATSGTIANGNGKYDANVFVPEETNEIDKICELLDYIENEKYHYQMKELLLQIKWLSNWK